MARPGAAPRGAPRPEPSPAPEPEAEPEEPEDEEPGNSSESLSQLMAIVGKELGQAVRESRPYDAALVSKARLVVADYRIFKIELDELLRLYQRARTFKLKANLAAAPAPEPVAARGPVKPGLH